jgi:hypothetical protein
MPTPRTCCQCFPNKKTPRNNNRSYQMVQHSRPRKPSSGELANIQTPKHTLKKTFPSEDLVPNNNHDRPTSLHCILHESNEISTPIVYFYIITSMLFPLTLVRKPRPAAVHANAVVLDVQTPHVTMLCYSLITSY